MLILKRNIVNILLKALGKAIVMLIMIFII
nr:MAG TPA: hypothetical protein [Caudoviricetes sp.]